MKLCDLDLSLSFYSTTIHLTLLIYATLSILTYYGVFDPCALLKVPYSRSCSSVGFPGLITYTKVNEIYLCFLPGTRFHQERRSKTSLTNCQNKR